MKFFPDKYKITHLWSNSFEDVSVYVDDDVASVSLQQHKISPFAALSYI